MKEREERYDLIHDRTITNKDDRRLVSMLWSIVSKAAEMSKRKRLIGLGEKCSVE